MRRSVLAALFGAVAGLGAVAINAPPGPGLDPDSMSYLGAAESLVRHGTLRIPMAEWSDRDSTSALRHFPPGFSVVIAVPVALGADPVQAARGVEAAAAFVTVTLGVWTAAASAGPAAGVLTGLLLLSAPALALDHARVLSEPLCFALLAATLALMLFTDRPLLYGGAAAAAGLVRYAAFPAGAAAVLWAFGLRGSLRDRARRAALAALPPLLLSGAVMARSVFASGTARQIAVHGGLGSTLRELGATLEAWLAPLLPAGPGAAALALVVGGAAAAALVFGARRGGTTPPEGEAPRAGSLVRAAALLAGCYAAFVLVSRVMVYDNIPFDDRMLSPVILVVNLALGPALVAAWRVWARPARIAALVAGVLWIGASAAATVRAIRDARDGGWGYASDDWRASPLAAWIRADGARFEIFSNDPAGVYFAAHRPSRNLPPNLDPAAVGTLGRMMSDRAAVIVGFDAEYEPMASPDSLAQRLGMRVVARFPDGTVWGR